MNIFKFLLVWFIGCCLIFLISFLVRFFLNLPFVFGWWLLGVAFWPFVIHQVFSVIHDFK